MQTLIMLCFRYKDHLRGRSYRAEDRRATLLPLASAFLAKMDIKPTAEHRFCPTLWEIKGEELQMD